jgi:hypothetical protein
LASRQSFRIPKNKADVLRNIGLVSGNILASRKGPLVFKNAKMVPENRSQAILDNLLRRFVFSSAAGLTYPLKNL